MTIGERIASLRKEKGISQIQLADDLGVTRQAVSKWETDQTVPDMRNFIRLAEIFDTEVEYLTTGNHPVYESPPVIVNVVEKVDKVVEKVVEKPVIKKVVRVKYVRNPVEFLLIGTACFLAGVVFGHFIW